MLEIKRSHMSLEETTPIKQHPERLLREIASTRVSSKRTEDFSDIATTFGMFEIFARPNDVKELTIQAIKSAEKHTQWSTDDKVNMGYYINSKSFYTPFFHEIGHFLLTNLGRSPETYKSHYMAEEHFCWNFAKDMTKVSRLPFSTEHANISREFVNFSGKLNIQDPVEHTKHFNKLLEKERILKGFSEEDRQEVIWTNDGRPQLRKYQ